MLRARTRRRKKQRRKEGEQTLWKRSMRTRHFLLRTRRRKKIMKLVWQGMRATGPAAAACRIRLFSSSFAGVSSDNQSRKKNIERNFGKHF